LGPATGGASGILGAGAEVSPFLTKGMAGLGRWEQAASEKPAAATSAKREALIIENPGQE
jgi:hypothetical protein